MLIVVLVFSVCDCMCIVCVFVCACVCVDFIATNRPHHSVALKNAKPHSEICRPGESTYGKSIKEPGQMLMTILELLDLFLFVDSIHSLLMSMCKLSVSCTCLELKIISK